MNSEIIKIYSEEEMIDVAKEFAKKINLGDVICFIGDLGVGKTFFIRHFINFFDKNIIVTSPTFNIVKSYKMNIYDKKVQINHFDIYRVDNIEDLENIGFYDYIEDKNSINLIEWADKIYEYLPKGALIIELSYASDDENERILEYYYL